MPNDAAARLAVLIDADSARATSRPPLQRLCIRAATVLAVLVLGTLPAVCGAYPGVPSGIPAQHGSTLHTRAELAAYLKAGLSPQSPLSLLPIGARRRFLGSIQWAPHGVGGFGYADLEQYLTDAEIHRVLALFGLQSFDTVVHGRHEPLTASERTAPESPLERKFDQLYFANDRSTRDGRPAVKIAPLYNCLLATYQSPATLDKLDASDVGLLFRAAVLIAGRVHDPRYLSDMLRDLEQLQARKLATRRIINAAHDQFVAARAFAGANTVAHDFASAGIAMLPPLVTARGIRKGTPSVLVLEPDGRSMRHLPIDMQVPVRIIVIAGCHFSEDAARAIRSAPRLDALFHAHAVWLADENESLPDVLVWNREFPNQLMNVAWRDADWPMLRSWLIPTFYIFRGGKLIDQWSGWPARTGMRTLRQHLVRDGLLSRS